jgi:hypothetical protein
VTEPTAIQKAEALYRYALQTGSKLETFSLILTAAEAFDALEHLCRAQSFCPEHNEAFGRDIAEARKKGDPWDLISEFRICGLKVARADRVLN